jgi:hypothetical protein
MVSALALGMAMAASGAAFSDVVHVDDTIIQGSLCVGFDCVNGENFGFDTLRLKENNLRIHFDDTSSSASFPSNDWRIVINDTSNGGASYFLIEDSTAGRQPFRIDAGAPSNSLRVDSSGRIGVGTANPVVELHVANGDSPTLRLEQNGSSGFTAQTFDVAANEANFFVRDVTNGSQLPFRIQPGADTDTLYLSNTNRVGVGTDAPNSQLHVLGNGVNDIGRFSGSGNKFLYLESTDNRATQMIFQSDSGNRRIVANNSSGVPETQLIFGDQEVTIAGPSNSGADVWAVIDANGITTQGPSCNPGPCDGTFDSARFEVPSIEDHAAFMWENSYLWGVGPTSPDRAFNLTEKTAGMLHELEVAHIYIEQLNTRLSALEAELAAE